MKLPTFFLLATAVINLLFSLFIIVKAKKNKINVSFVAITLGIFFWSVSLYFFRNVISIPEILFWGKFSYVAASVATFAIFSFAYYFPDNNKKISWLNFFISFSILLAVCYFSIFTDVFIEGATKIEDSNSLIYNKTGNSFFGLYVMSFMAMSFYLLYKKYKKYSGLEKLQLRYILIGVFSSMFIGFIYSFIFTTLGDFRFNWVGPTSTLIMVSLEFYAIIKYRLMGIRTIASKLFIYFSISLFGYSLFYSGVILENKYVGGYFSTTAFVLNFFFVFIFSVLIFPIIDFIQKFSDTLFFRGNNPKKIIKDVALQMSSVINLDELVKITKEEFKKLLTIEEVDIYLFKENKNIVCISGSDNEIIELKARNSICRHIVKDKMIIVREEIDKKQNRYLAHELDKLHAKVVAPLIIRQKVIGLILLGEKMDSSPYTKEDIEFLEIIISQAAVAIENARLYQEVENFNKTLQQKVDEQTKEIREKAEHLRKLMDMRSEFLDITSHQLRTPVTVIKGVLSMIEEGSVPKNKQKEFLRGALDKSMKLGEIINDILRASEMDTDKFTMTLSSVDLNPILDKIKEDKLRSIQTKNVKLLFKLPKKPLPQVLSNEKYIEQAIINLINNSFQYTAKGSVTVSSEEKKDSLIIKVADTGIGIPEKDRAKLFQKFGRAQNAVQTYTDGSGLGLFIIKQIMDATPGGKVEIEKTEVDKGTTFALTFPLASTKSSQEILAGIKSPADEINIKKY